MRFGYLLQIRGAKPQMSLHSLATAFSSDQKIWSLSKQAYNQREAVKPELRQKVVCFFVCVDA